MSKRVFVVFGLAALLGSSCAHVPSAGFQGMEVKAIQPDVKKASVKLDLLLLFAVRSGDTIPLVVPPHEYSIDVGGVRVSGGKKTERLLLRPGESATLRYPVTLDLSGPSLSPLLGSEVPIHFEVEVPVDAADTADALAETTEGKVKEGATAAGQIASVLPAELRHGKLTLSHEGRLRLPRFPEVRRPSLATVRIELLPSDGPNPMADAVARLRAAKEDLERARQSLEQKLAAVEQFVQTPPSTAWPPKVPLGDALKAAGVSTLRWSLPAMCNFNCAGNPGAPVPEGTSDLHYVDSWRNQCERSFTPRCKEATICPPGFTRVQGNVPTECVASFDYRMMRDMAAAQLGVASSDASLIPAPKLPALSSLVDLRVVRNEWNRVRSDLDAILGQPELAGLDTLLAAPAGIRFVVPLTIANPNAFPLPAPSFLIETKAAGRPKPVGRIQMTPAAASGCPAEIPACLPAKGEAQANVEVELRWSELGGVASLIRGTGALPAPVIDGSLSVDLGFGQLVLPLEIGP